MCYSTQQGKPLSELEKALNVVAKLPEYLDDDDLQQYHINGFAKQSLKGGTKESIHPIMAIQPQENPKFLAPLMWGFIPSWELGENAEQYYADTRGVGSGLNATSEKIFTSRMFMDSADNRRCIVPVTGFYEPYRVTHVKKPFSIPFFFERRDKEVTKLAGIYSFTKDGHATFAIITKPATPLFEKIHHTKKRRPVILHDDQVEGWLDRTSSRSDLENLIDNDMPDELIYAQPISRDLYRPKVDSNRPDITKPVHHTEIAIDYENKPQQDLFG